jgi:nucleoside-diphosphate-sugar epimerase
MWRNRCGKGNIEKPRASCADNHSLGMFVMKSILFGGEGFIGRGLKKRLADAGCVVKTLDLAESSDIRGSVADFSTVASAIESFEPDLAVNLAGLVGVPACAENPELAFQSNVVGAWNVALACALSRLRLIHISSTAVYGAAASRKNIVVEEDECVPQSVYGFTKLMGEYAVKSACAAKALVSIILRPSNVYGSKQKERNVIQIFVEKASEKSPITIHGDGKQTKCFTFVDDAVEGITRVSLADWKLQDGEYKIYNVSVGRSWSLLDLVTILEKHYGRLQVSFEPSRKGDFSEAVYSIRQIKRDYGFEPTYDLESGVNEVLKDMTSSN